MAAEPGFDLAEAHKHFSAYCFNHAWDLIDQMERTPAEEQQMVLLCLTSLWHWSQREDCTPTHLSIGYWQAARVFALLGQAWNAQRYAQLCLDASQEPGVQPFYLGYAYEALARAAAVSKDPERMAAFLAMAREVAESITDAQERNLLLKDLDTIA